MWKNILVRLAESLLVLAVFVSQFSLCWWLFGKPVAFVNLALQVAVAIWIAFEIRRAPTLDDQHINETTNNSPNKNSNNDQM